MDNAAEGIVSNKINALQYSIVNYIYSFEGILPLFWGLSGRVLSQGLHPELRYWRRAGNRGLRV